jgi:4-aminobutyrate aminotransferase-like enzyme
VTGHRHVLALEAAYHGNTQAAIEVSHYKFSGPGGSGCPPTTRVLPMPCVFRGCYRSTHPEPGASYALDVENVLQEMLHAAQPPAAFVAESMLGVGGQVVLPPGYLAGVYPAVRSAGGLCIADEVQVGFGRCGSHRWAFEMQAVVPDIVTLGKPIGNGHPLAAVITTEEISSAFDNGMEYFNTYGGNPVSCAVGRAVLSIIDQENLQARASSLGQHMLKQWGSLKEQHEIIGDVRGSGLFLGIELVSDRGTLEPASAASYQLVEAMKDRGILLSVDGPFHNVIKFKPPLVFDRDNADDLYRALDEELGRL